MAGDPKPDEGRHRRAEDLGPSGFDPYAPYTPVDPGTASSPSYPMDNQEKNLALLAHLLGCLGVVAGSLLGFLGPLIIWLTQKDKSAFVEEQAREALNFQISLLILMAICSVVVGATCGMFFPLLFIPMVLQVVFGIIATMSVAGGNAYRYPYNLRLIK
ncbi:MAG: DUF4870 domain-containing protein [Planctomycetaceae bacterium]